MSLNGKEVKRILCLIGCPFGITRFAPTKAKFLEGIFFPRVKTLIIIIIIIIIIIQTYLCRIAASVLRKKTAINAGPVKN